MAWSLQAPAAVIMNMFVCLFIAALATMDIAQATVESFVEAHRARNLAPSPVFAFNAIPGAVTHHFPSFVRSRLVARLADDHAKPAAVVPFPTNEKHSAGFVAAATFRGGAASSGAASPRSESRSQMGRILLDQVEDVIGALFKSLSIIAVPALHLVRLGFGLSLTFYGMAFRTFAFHVIVFRIAGLRQVQKAFGSMCTKYRMARQSIRTAADAAGTLKDITSDKKLNDVRNEMIEEKNKLMADGRLSAEETAYFMRKYKKSLHRIIEEQERFKSARSSLVSVRHSVSPDEARASIGGLYNALVTGFTASTIPQAGRLTLGLHIGGLLKTHTLDMFGAYFDPIGYGLDLNKYFDQEDIPYMGKANAMGGSANLAMNIVCYGVVLGVFQVHPSVALKASMVYYGARVVTDYIDGVIDYVRKRLGLKSIKHSPLSAAIHAALTLLGFYYHRGMLSTSGKRGRVPPLAVGPGPIGLVEPYVRLAVKVSNLLHAFEATRVHFVQDPVQAVKEMAEDIAELVD